MCVLLHQVFIFNFISGYPCYRPSEAKWHLVQFNLALTTAHPQLGSLALSRTGLGCSESEVTQLCLTLCHPMDGSLPGSAVHGIFQARILEWAAISFSRGSSQPRDRTQGCCIADRCFTIWALGKPRVQWNVSQIIYLLLLIVETMSSVFTLGSDAEDRLAIVIKSFSLVF